MTLPTKPIRSLRPTLDTPFHIDYEWWNKGDRDLRVYLRSHLCAEHRAQLAEANQDGDLIDWIIVDAAFRVFLTNDNQPLTPRELAERIDRDAETILRTIGGKQVYQGIRPASG